VLEEVRDLAGNGYKEVVLTGIHLSSYGIDFTHFRHLGKLFCKLFRNNPRLKRTETDPFDPFDFVYFFYKVKQMSLFEASYAFVDRVDFYETHIFKYSKREGTKAAVMDGQIDEKIKGERSARMIALGERKKKAYEDSFIGKEVEVLFEERAQIEGKAVMTGHTKEYMKIALEPKKIFLIVS